MEGGQRRGIVTARLDRQQREPLTGRNVPARRHHPGRGATPGGGAPMIVPVRERSIHAGGLIKDAPRS